MLLLLLLDLIRKIIITYRADISYLKLRLISFILKNRKIFIDNYHYFSMNCFMEFSLVIFTIGVILYLSI